MPASLFPRALHRKRIEAAFGDPDEMRRLLGAVTLPDNLENWLTRLMLLHGVPINYLVPDEGMLPPESIRVFYLDMNWVDAMVDGAFSIGRNLTQDNSTASARLDAAVLPGVRKQVRAHASAIRAKAFGVAAPPVTLQTVTGFLLRSSVVQKYPGIGVLAYPKGSAPGEGGTVVELPLLRLQQLGPQSDTIVCLVDGDAYRVDIHEPPEQLHYGIDSYDAASGTAVKMIHKFHRDGSSVRIDPTPVEVQVGGCFRTQSPRTMMMSRLAARIAHHNQVPSIDSSEMGFEMTQGVGMVAFVRRTS